MGFLNALPIVGQLIDKIIPDPEKRLELKLELEKIDLQRDIAGLEAAKAMLSNGHWFVSGAIPSLIWLASIMLTTNCVLIPFAAFFSQVIWGVKIDIPLIQYPGEYWYLLGVVITGLFAKKSADKGLQLGSFKTATNQSTDAGSGQDKRPDWLLGRNEKE